MRTICVKTKTGRWKDELLLDDIAQYREVNTPKSTLRLEALRAAGAEPNGAWVKEAYTLIQGLERPEDAAEDGQYQIPLTEEDEDILQHVAQQLRQELGLQRVQVALVFRIVLAHSLILMRQRANRAAGVITSLRGQGVGIDVFAWWLCYQELKRDPEMANDMETLRGLCRRLLDEDEELYGAWRAAATQQLRGLTDGYGPDKVATRGPNLGSVNVLFLAKALAGLLAFRAEASGMPLPKLIKSLK